MYTCKYFNIRELVSPQILMVIKEGAMWLMIGSERAQVLDMIREDYEAEVTRQGLYKSRQDVQIFINGMFGLKKFTQSGVRAANCKIGAPNSRHKFAEAFDLKALHMDILFGLLKKNESKYRLTRKENPKVTKTWAHIEILGGISKAYVFNP